jgi:hypothetical protein
MTKLLVSDGNRNEESQSDTGGGMILPTARTSDANGNPGKKMKGHAL